MIITRYDRPIGLAKANGAQLSKPLNQLCAEAGLHPASGYTFRRRHPECRDWPAERIVEQLLANRDQSAVARRQGQVPGNGRSCFGGLRYAD